MPEVANPIEPGVDEHAVLIARRNTLMSELLRIAPALNPPEKAKPIAPRIDREPQKVKREVSPETQIKRMVDRNEKAKTESIVDNPSLLTINGIHVDLYDYFSINADRATDDQVRKLQFVHSHILEHNADFRQGLKKLNTIDNRLGSSDVGEAKLAKLYNWLRLHRGDS